MLYYVKIFIECDKFDGVEWVIWELEQDLGIFVEIKVELVVIKVYFYILEEVYVDVLFVLENVIEMMDDKIFKVCYVFIMV